MNWYARNIALPLVLFVRDNWPLLLRLILPGYQPRLPQEDPDEQRFNAELARQRGEWKSVLGAAERDAEVGHPPAGN